MKNIFFLITLFSCCLSLDAQRITFSQAGCNTFTFSYSPSPAAIQWDFGDGQSTNQLSPTHRYGNVGTFVVSALVNGAAISDTILVDDCCAAQSMTAVEHGACCFDVSITNAETELFTGFRLGLRAPGQFAGSYFDPAIWGEPLPPTSSEIRLEYIGAPHVPVGTIPAVRVCLSGDTQASGPLQLYGAWTVGPDTICIDTIALACATCEPDGKTFVTNINSIREPDPDNNIWDYNEFGQAVIVADPDRETLLFGGITQSLRNDGILNDNNNLICGTVDACGELIGTPCIAAPEGDDTDWMDYQFIDLRNGNFNQSGDYLKVGTINRPGLNQEIGIAFLDDNDCVLSIQDVSQTPNLRETVTDAILIGSKLYIVGNVYRQPAGQIPVTDAFVTVYDINNTGTPPTLTFSLGRHTRAEALTFHNGQLWVTGGVDEKAFLAEISPGLLLLNTNVYDLDNNPQSSEIGRTIDIDNNGDIVIFGDWSVGGVVRGDNRIFLLKLPAIINECPLRPRGNILYDFAGGGEKVVDALVDGREYLITGTAKVPSVALGGAVPADRVFLSRLKPRGNPVFLRTYEAQQVRQLDRIKESFLMVGTQIHEGPFISQPFPQATTRADIWLARTDKDGKVADCDCYEDLGFDTSEPDDVTACGTSTRGGYQHFPVSYLMEKAEVPGVQDYCGEPCGPGGGGGDICPPGVCCGYISGYKFEDRNDDGLQDPFDSEICGWTIELYDNLNNLVATTTTNQAGFYSFGGLCDGDYTVRERLENCWIQNFPTPGSYPVTIDATMYRHYQKNFGNKLELDCRQLNSLPRFNNQGGTDCSWSLRLDNNVCPDVTLMKITSATPGITMNATGYEPGFTNYLPRPNTPTELWATGGNNNAVRNPLARGNNLSVVDFDVDYDCDPVPAPRIQKFYVDYYLDLPCSLADQSYCRDSFFLDCSFPCPPQNDCLVEATATKTADPDDLCCYDLSFFIDPVHVDEFTQLEIRPLPGAALTPLASLDPQYSLISNTNSLISLVSNTGNLCNGLDRYFPTGTLPSVELCVDGFSGNMPMVEVDFVKCEGAVCSDTLTFACSPCLEIVNDTLYCDGSDLKYVFDFQNTWDRPIKKLAVNNFAPAGAVFTPDTLFFPAGLPVGAVAGANTICVSNVSAPDSLKFDFKALGDDECCFCISNEICKPIPVCCDTCESIEYLLTDTIINGEECCYSLDFYHCTDSLFTALRLKALNGVTISQQSAGPGWSMYSPALSSNTQQTWFPRPTPIHLTNIPTGWTRTKVNFCLGNYDGGPLPQVVELEWLGGSDQNVICTDSLYFECSRPPADSTCVLVTDTTWTCNPDGSYDLDLAVQIKWPVTAFQIYVDSLVSTPAGAVFTPDPLVLNGVFPTNSVVSMPTLNVSNVGPGDTICFDLALADTLTNYVNKCCHVEVCLEVPPCPGGRTDCEELGLPVYDHDRMGWAAATCFSGFNNNDWQQGISNSDYVMGLIDVRNAAAAPRGSNWSPPMQHYPAFRADTLGQVFGLAVDEGTCIYVTASSLYGNSISGVIGFNWGMAGPGGVYKLCPDASGAYHVSNTTSLPNGGSGLGQVTYDPVHQQLFVSNFQDGEIYRLDANTLVPLGPNYDFPGYATAAPAANPDFIALGERVWAVEYNPFDGKLYFSVWGEDQRNMGNAAARNRLYSIDIDPGTGDFTGAASYVLDLPGRDYDGTLTTNNTMPISDLAFSKAGRMLVTERTMSGEHMNQPYVNWPAHGARTFSYEWSGSQWTNPRLQHIGSYNSTWNTNEHANSAGGVDFGYRDGLEGCDSMIWNMGDALQFGPQFIYGIQGHEWPGNSNQPTDPDYVVTNSLFIDLDGTINSTKKTQYGDVEIFRDPCCGDPVVIEPNDCAQWEADVRAQGFTITQIPNTGDLLITPPAAMTASDWWELDPGCDGQVSVAISGNGTHTFPSGIRWYFCIDAYRVTDGDTCHVAFAYDGLLEIDPPETCLPADDFMALVAERIDIDHLGTRVVINATGLSNNCELTVDFGDDSEIRTYTLEQLPITYDYQESGRFRPQVTVIEYDDSGMECNTSTTATANPDAINIGLKLYPNPNQGRFKLDFHLPQAGEINVEVFDLAGRKVLIGRHRFNVGQQQLDLDAAHLPPGTYVLRMVGSGFVAAAKFQRVR